LNARLQSRLLQRRPRALPPPAGEGPASFGTIIRRTSAPQRRAARAVLIVLGIALALATLFLCAHSFFRALIFGGA
jgi:hypothetical protein